MALRYYLLVPKDQRVDTWLFHKPDDLGKMCRLPEVLQIQCANCGKFDERVALHRRTTADIRVRSKVDLVCAVEGVMLASHRFRQVITENAITGCDFSPVRGDDRYWVLHPTVLVATDLATSGLRVVTPAETGSVEASEFPCVVDKELRCVACHRRFQVLGWPGLTSMTLPKDPKTIFVSDIPLEQPGWYSPLLYGSEDVVTILRGSKITGIDYTPVQ